MAVAMLAIFCGLELIVIGILAMAFWVAKAGREVSEKNWRSRERAMVDEARRREQGLLDKLIALSSRDPVIIDSSEAIKGIGEAIARITQGPPEAFVEQTRLKQDVAEEFRRAMIQAEGGGVDFVPFGDVDGWMDPEAAAKVGRDRPVEAVATSHFANVGNGHGDLRLDGKPIEFRSGEGGSPPTGGWED